MNAEIILRKRAELTPRREAFVEVASGRRFTYEMLEQRAAQMAFWLQSVGVQRGDRVALLAHNSVLFVDTLFACMKLGAIFNPLNWRLAAPELVYIVNDSEPKMMIVGPEFTGLVEKMEPQVMIPRYAVCEGASLEIDALPFVFELEAGIDSQPERPFIGVDLPDDTPACILHTSGTTGRPKGAMIPHRQIFWNAINTIISWGLSARDVSPIFTPMFHSGGLFVFLTPLFYCGGRIVVTRTFDAAESLKSIEEESCTVILGVPTLFQVWLESGALETTDLSRVRWFISGGAPCPPALINEWTQRTGVPLKQGYGLTEAGTNCFTMTIEDSQRKVGSVGKPVFHSQMRLVDEQGRDVPEGETGELLIAGPHVMVGYWALVEETTRALRNGWLYTGDMARRDADGFYYIVGRFKDMLISGGENVYAAEVEAILNQHDKVQACALIGKPDKKWGEVGLMVVVPARPEQPPSRAELADFLAVRLARFKVPQEFVFADRLPTTPYGKVEKVKLREQYLGVT